MRKPMPPPPFDELTQKVWVNDRSIGEIVRVQASGYVDKPYWHWDEIRYRKPPAGLTHDEWWFAIKLARWSNRRRLPLEDQQGSPFVYGLPDQVLRETDFINKNASGRIALSEQVTNPATQREYLVSSLIEEAVTSSQLEGASTNKRVAREMIRSGREPRDRSERMILNNYYAMEKVGELRDEPLTIDLILEIHRVVTEGTLENPNAAGRFQHPGEERVGVYDNTNGADSLLYAPPPADEIPKRMHALCQFANDTDSGSYLPGVLRALTIHFMIGYIHPFEDGNGRTARILFYWSMLNQGYWLTEFLSVSSMLKKAPSRYARSFLFTETDENDLTYFYIYHLDILHKAIDSLMGYLMRKMEEAQKVRRMLADQAEAFNSRQIALIRNALKNPTTTYSVQSHMRSHRIAMETARKDLAKLEELGLLIATRVGKRNIYTSAPDLGAAINQHNAWRSSHKNA